MEGFPAYDVWCNLEKFANYRGLKLLDYKKLSESEFVEKLSGYESWIVVSAEDKPDKPPRRNNTMGRPTKTYIILVNDKDEHISRAAELNSIVSSVSDWPRSRRTKNNVEVILITYLALQKANFVKKIKEINELEKETDIWGYGHIFNVPYHMLTSVIPEYSAAPKYRIMKDEEIVALPRSKHKKLFQSDPQAVWVDARKGDTVECTLKNEASITAITYRDVV